MIVNTVVFEAKYIVWKSWNYKKFENSEIILEKKIFNQIKSLARGDFCLKCSYVNQLCALVTHLYHVFVE